MTGASSSGTSPFHRLWALGYRRLVPIIPPLAEPSPYSAIARKPNSRGKAVGELGPSGWRGLQWHTLETTEEHLDRWAAMQAGVGCRTGQGLVGIDIDVTHEGYAEQITRIAFETLGRAPRRIGRAPKVVLLYRTAADEYLPYQRVEIVMPDGSRQLVELSGEGRQIVLGGIHPGTLEPYRWPDGVPPFDDLVLVTSEQIRAFFERVVAEVPGATYKAPSVVNNAFVDQETLRGRLEDIRRCVALIPNDRSDRDRFTSLCIAIKAALPDEPEEAFQIAWSWAAQYVNPQTGEAKSYDRFVGDWTGMRAPFRIGAKAVYDEAGRVTNMNQTPPDAFFGPVDPDMLDTSLFPKDVKAARSRLAFVRMGEAADSALADLARPLVKGLLDWGTMSILYGDSNVGKTFVGMDLAHHVSTGRAWGGMKVAPAAVAYVAAEGGRGARKRLAALRRKHGDSAQFFLLMAPVDLLHRDGDMPALVEAIKGLESEHDVEIGLVVIDTFSRALAGGDENSSVDMGAMVKNLDHLRLHSGAHLMVVHHTGKDAAKGARGHSLLRAAIDTEIEVSVGQITVTKQRDLDKAWASAFELEVVTLGRDGDGDPVTSCTVRLMTHVAEAAPGLATPKERLVLDAVETCLETGEAGKGVSIPEALSAVAGGMSKEDVRFHVRSLVAKNLLKKVERGRWTVRDNLSAARLIKPENGFFD
ncbi:MAG: AAA family ATPase [Methylorubrum rhodinum]|uniref:AAA family ATPase n=1 Tax=Methylorubrum rhodinum TaxID=29428 RepID=UPI003BB0544D